MSMQSEPLATPGRAHESLEFSPQPGEFVIGVEVVPPAGGNAEALLAQVEALGALPIDAFSVASNPVAKARMSALAMSALIQRRTGRAAVLHCTTRDHNRLATQSLLWGALALGIGTVLVATGDYVALGERAPTTTVRDLNVFDLVRMARKAGLRAGVVLDPRPEYNRLAHEVHRLEDKVAAGAQFVVTQPAFDEASAREIREVTSHLGVPVILGVLPLRSARHADFLHDRVAGIAVPDAVREKMHTATNPLAEGNTLARDMLAVARAWFDGACLMPAFDHYEVVCDLLRPGGAGIA